MSCDSVSTPSKKLMFGESTANKISKERGHRTTKFPSARQVDSTFRSVTRREAEETLLERKQQLANLEKQVEMRYEAIRQAMELLSEQERLMIEDKDSIAKNLGLTRGALIAAFKNHNEKAASLSIWLQREERCRERMEIEKTKALAQAKQRRMSLFEELNEVGLVSNALLNNVQKKAEGGSAVYIAPIRFLEEGEGEGAGDERQHVLDIQEQEQEQEQEQKQKQVQEQDAKLNAIVSDADTAATRLNSMRSASSSLPSSPRLSISETKQSNAFESKSIAESSVRASLSYKENLVTADTTKIVPPTPPPPPSRPSVISSTSSSSSLSTSSPPPPPPPPPPQLSNPPTSNSRSPSSSFSPSPPPPPPLSPPLPSASPYASPYASVPIPIDSLKDLKESETKKILTQPPPPPGPRPTSQRSKSIVQGMQGITQGVSQASIPSPPPPPPPPPPPSTRSLNSLFPSVD